MMQLSRKLFTFLLRTYSIEAEAINHQLGMALLLHSIPLIFFIALSTIWLRGSKPLDIHMTGQVLQFLAAFTGFSILPKEESLVTSETVVRETTLMLWRTNYRYILTSATKQFITFTAKNYGTILRLCVLTTGLGITIYIILIGFNVRPMPEQIAVCLEPDVLRTIIQPWTLSHPHCAYLFIWFNSDSYVYCSLPIVIAGIWLITQRSKAAKVLGVILFLPFAPILIVGAILFILWLIVENIILYSIGLFLSAVVSLLALFLLFFILLVFLLSLTSVKVLLLPYRIMGIVLDGVNTSRDRKVEMLTLMAVVLGTLGTFLVLL